MGGKHSGSPDTAPQDGHRDKPPTIDPKDGGGRSGGAGPEKK